MLELKHNTLRFSFPDVHDDAHFSIDFQRTLRIPDDGEAYPLPPGLGTFPVRHIDDFAKRVPASWREHGGVMLPMHQSEALWLNFKSTTRYPFLVKIAAGKINAITGDEWTNAPSFDRQDYVVIPDQPWLDGYCVEDDEIRQFVAMPLGDGYTAEEQLTGEAVHGGIQIVAYPLKASVWRERMEARPSILECCASISNLQKNVCYDVADMGLAPGGRMRQKIYDDPNRQGEWDLGQHSRCFVHLANSEVWRDITGQAPPTLPLTAKDYTKAGMPWFDLYDESKASLPGDKKLRKLKGVVELGNSKNEQPLPENESVEPGNVMKLGRTGVVREGNF